jgi:cytidylate kinase
MEKQRNITIAIDGYSSCGKSTLAKALAKALGYIYVDSGAMYRGVALFALRRGWVNSNAADVEQILAAIEDIDLRFEMNAAGQPELFLNGVCVEREIRTLDVSNVVSRVAPIKEVREHLVRLQRRMGDQGGVVMDGRDIGSVVFPDAELKLFVTADPEIRAQRRFKELSDKGENITLTEVAENLNERDRLDTTRKESPLIQVNDAVVLDNSNMTRDEQLQWAIQQAKARM